MHYISLYLSPSPASTHTHPYNLATPHFLLSFPVPLHLPFSTDPRPVKTSAAKKENKYVQHPMPVKGLE